MQKNVFQAYFMLMTFFWALSGISRAIDIGPVREIYSTSHTEDTPASVPVVQVKWQPPENTQADGYYVMFNTQMTHVFDQFNTANENVDRIRETQYSSSDLSGADNVAYYFHIAAYYFHEDIEYIGPTESAGPFRVDTVAPRLPLVEAPDVVRNRMITISLGAQGASEMFISNANYETNGQWEPFAQQRTWELLDVQGYQRIYVVFRDLAGNTSKASTAIRFDTLPPVPHIQTSAPLPARSSPIPITIAFNEPVFDFTDSDIQVNNCLIQKFSPETQSIYLLECLPDQPGKIYLSINENELTDEAGNLNLASNAFEWIYNTQPPEIHPIPDLMIIENAGSETISFSVTNSNAYSGVLIIKAWADLESLVKPQDMVIANQSNPFAISLNAGETQTLDLRIRPQQDQSGSTPIHVMISDATGLTAQTMFQLDVWDAPNISPIPDLQMDESAEFSIPLMLTDVYKERLIVSMTTSNSDLMGFNHMKLFGNNVLGDKFPYICQTTNNASISVQLYFKPPLYEYGMVNLSITAENTKGLTQTREFTLDIQEKNDLPELVMGQSCRCVEDTIARMPITITDIEEGTLKVTATVSQNNLLQNDGMIWVMNNERLPNPMEIQISSSLPQDLVLELSPIDNAFGDTTVTVRVDDADVFVEKTFLLTVDPVNDPPVIPGALSFTINEDANPGTLVGRIDAQDVDQQTLIYEIDPAIDFLVKSTGDIVLKSNLDYETNNHYTLAASVSDGYSVSTTSVNIFVNNTNDNPPLVADSFHSNVQENTPIGSILFTVEASDIDNDPLTYAVTWKTDAPFAITQTTGQVWINQAVDYEIAKQHKGTVTVSDGIFMESRPLTITIVDLNEKPTIFGSPDQTVIQGNAYTFQPIANDPDLDDDELIFSIKNKPNWAVFDLLTGKLFGTPTGADVRSYTNIEITVRDSAGLSESLPSFDITVLNVNDPPHLNSPIPDTSVNKNEPLIYTFPLDTFVDPDIDDKLSYTATLNNGDPLPDWLMFTSSTRTFSGTPGIFDGGILTIQVTAFDTSMAETSDEFSLTVIDNNKPPVLTLTAQGVSFTENNGAITIDEYARVSDPDSNNFENGLLWVSFFNGGSEQDRLLIKNSSLIDLDRDKIYSESKLIGTFSGGSSGTPLTITFTNWANLSIVNELLVNIMYNNDSENPSETPRQVEFKISDGDGATSAPVYKTIHVHTINDKPILTINQSEVFSPHYLANIDEDSSIIFENERLLQIKDSDAGNDKFDVSITANQGSLSLEYSQGVSGNHTSSLSFDGNLSEVNNLLSTLKYTAFRNQSGLEKLNFSFNDKGYSDNPINQTIQFNIEPVDDPPILSNIEPKTVNEDSPIQIPFSLTEVDGGEHKVTLKIQSSRPDLIKNDFILETSGNQTQGPGNSFVVTVNNNHLSLTLTTTPYENKTGNATIEILAKDSEPDGTLTATTQVSINITPVNDPPIVKDISYSCLEDQTLTKSLSQLAEDPENDPMEYVIVTPPDHGTFVFNTEKNSFTYTPNSNFSGSDGVTYRVKDSEYTSNSGKIHFNISSVNDPPRIDPIDNYTLISPETKTITVTAYDVDDSIDINVSTDNSLLFPSLKLEKQANSRYSLKLAPTSGEFGTANIVITARDLEVTVEEEFTVQVVNEDHTPPTIVLYDDRVTYIDLNTPYVEPDFIAIDNVDGNITEAVVVQNNLNIHIEGEYNITYQATDSAGNKSSVEQIIIVSKNEFQSNIISGTIIDEFGDPVPWVKVKIERQGEQYLLENDQDNGSFEKEIPFDGSIWQMHLSRDDYYPQTIQFSKPQSFGKIVMYPIDDAGSKLEVLQGQCLSYQNTPLSDVSIRAKSSTTQNIIATSFSDSSGFYTLVVHKDHQPYTFEAHKYGYETLSFQGDSAASLILVPKTTIMIESQPETTNEHESARRDNQVEILIKANPSFVGTDNELLIPEPDSNQFSKRYIGSGEYEVTYNAYENFSMIIHADTTEDRNAGTGYFAKKEFSFQPLGESAQVSVIKGDEAYQVIEPFYVENPEKSFMWVDRGEFTDMGYPINFHYTIKDYVIPNENDNLANHIAAFELTDDYGDNLESTENAICLGIRFESPVTREKLESNEYQLVHAETIQDLILGNGQVETSINIFEHHVTLCVQHLSAFGFQKKSEENCESCGDPSSSGCFLRMLFNDFGN